MALPSFSQIIQGISNAMIPKEGPKALPVNLDFSQAASYEIDLSNQQASAQIAFVQGVYIDNLDNTESVTLTVGISGQRIPVGPGKCQYVPLLVPNPPKFVATSAGSAIVRFHFLNVPLPMGWLDAVAEGGFNFDGDGNLLVDMPAFDALISDQGSGNGLNVNVISGGGGGSGGVAGLPLSHYALTGGPTTLLTATGAGARYRLTGLVLSVDPTIYHATDGGAEYSWTISQAATRTLFRGNFYLPKRASVWNGPSQSQCPIILNASNFEDVGTVDNEVLRWNLSASISGGFFFCTVYGTANYIPA